MKFFSLLLLLTFFSNTPFAGAIDWKTNRVTPLEKITVGPWDNFSSTISEDDSKIYFTRNSHQIPNIYVQDLNTTTVERYIGEKGDAKHAVFNDQNNLLAFTYFKYDSQGDICLVDIKNKLIECITSKETVDQAAFWIDAKNLGFIRRKASQLNWELVEYNLPTKQIRVLSSGNISAPNASYDGRYILFNQLQQEQSNIQIYDRKTQSITQLSGFDLSGITGFLTFSRNGEFIYFNHYLNDTNADQKIDGSDHSVVFRVPLKTWFSATSPLLPEQLTSVKNDCKFPSLSHQYLYVTCAFENSLDIYRLPLTGVVPTEWNKKQVWEAHKTARSYEQRLLLLNTLRTRFGMNDHTMMEKILSNHLEIGELSAARYYIHSLIQYYKTSNELAMAEFYAALNEFILVRSSKQRVPINIVTTRFQKQVAVTRKKINQIENKPILKALLNAYLDYELEDNASALSTLQTINIKEKLLPLERYMIFELYQQLLLPEQATLLLALYPEMFRAPEIESDARLYYAFSYLKQLNQISLPIKQREENIDIQIRGSKDKTINALFQVELLSLAIGKSDDKKTQRVLFKKLTTLLKKNSKNTLLRKAMHTRAIQNLTQANQLTYMELISRHWLTMTHVSEMEFTHAAEQYAIITTNKAYGEMANNTLAKAYSLFYSTIRQTNDLEAHFQFITLGLTLKLNKKENLKQSYALLDEQNLLGENKRYVEALQQVIQAEINRPVNMDTLDDALSTLTKMRSTGLNPAMKDLLMGYIYHLKLRASQKGYAYDKRYFQQAHYHYMMALDLAQNNTRITATVWQNLGWLQFEVRQYGLAENFFQHRLKLPFIHRMNEVSVRWMLARSLFYNNQKKAALKQAETTLTLVKTHKLGNTTPYLEKSAFYAMQAEQYEKSAKYYELLFNLHTLNKENKAKALLAYAYVLTRLKKIPEATDQFKQLLNLSHSLTGLKSNNQRLLASYPQRFQLLAYGFLANLSMDQQEKIHYRQQRVKLFKEIKGKTSQYAYDEAGRLSFLIKDLHHIAIANEKLKKYQPMTQAMHEALQMAETWMNETKDAMGPVIYRTLLNYLTLNIEHPSFFSSKETKNLNRIIQQVFSAFQNYPYPSSFVVYQHNKLRVLHMALNNRADQFDDFLQKAELKRLQKESPDAFEEIRRLVTRFR